MKSKFVVNYYAGKCKNSKPLDEFIKEFFKELHIEVDRDDVVGLRYIAHYCVIDDGVETKKSEVFFVDGVEENLELQFLYHIGFRELKNKFYHVEVINVYGDGKDDFEVVFFSDRMN